jgi:hypothetical protein
VPDYRRRRRASSSTCFVAVVVVVIVVVVVVVVVREPTSYARCFRPVREKLQSSDRAAADPRRAKTESDGNL